MFKVLLWAFAIYMLYRFIFGFVVPVSKTASQIKQKMSEMQQQQAFQQHEFARQQEQQKPSAGPSPTTKKDDYLDFEEIK